MAELDLMEKIVSLCKRRGFVFQGSEIYGGLAGTWDYGPLGVELKNNIKALWWRMFVQERDDMYGVDAAIVMNPKVWEASGHVSGFSDPLVECNNCHTRFRVDQLISDQEKYQQYLAVFGKDYIERNFNMFNDLSEDRDTLLDNFAQTLKSGSAPRNKEKDEFEKIMQKINAGIAINRITISSLNQARQYKGVFPQVYLSIYHHCPTCNANDWSNIGEFNMMLKTHVGVIENASTTAYLRPETAGGIFVNFKNVVDAFHPKLPFGIGQIGKAFRNEIAPRDFVFRSREFEQMEVEYFVRPEEWKEKFEEWKNVMLRFMDTVGIKKESVHELEVADGDRAHYSKRTIDFEFDFPFGRKELYGLAYRTDFDLSAHQAASGKTLTYSEEGQDPMVPHVIEPSLGVDRTVLAVLASAYTEDDLGEEKRAYLKFAPAVAPIKVAVFPLLKNKPELVAKAREVYALLKKEIPQVVFDDNGNVGKRYRRQDEIGTPWCVTIDFDTLGENPELKDTVTVRDRDTGEQTRVSVGELAPLLLSRLKV